ncbi:MAG: sensor domain-containing diguanylate cyclase [Synergistaceae bacterium]|nr:sensor domain-containing diguanylate cyclase [Synergistaceae bacterium]
MSEGWLDPSLGAGSSMVPMINFLNPGDDTCYCSQEDRQLIIHELLERSPTGVLILTAEGKVLLMNDAAKRLFEYDWRPGKETAWVDLMKSRILCDQDSNPITKDPIDIVIKERGRISANLLIKSRDKIPEEKWASITAFPVERDGGLVAVVALLIDITSFKGTEEALYHQATHDPLTGLSNRVFFSASLKKAVARVRRGYLGGAVFMIDLDRFKEVNDTYGHAAGDELLKSVANRMCSEVRETDLVARIGGDEFAILLSDVRDTNDLYAIGEVAERICKSISRPFKLGNNEASVTASIGISMYPNDGLDEDLLLSKADTALYVVKQSERDGWRFADI